MRIDDGVPELPDGADAFDLFNPAAYTTDSAHGVWRLLRQVQPVRQGTSSNGTSYWSFFRYEQCEAILKQATLFSSEYGTILASVGADDPAGGKTITLTDPPEHSRIRRPSMRRFGPAALRPRQADIRRGVLGLLESVLAGGEHDVAPLLRRLPMVAAGSLLGIAGDHWDSLAFHSTCSIAPDDPSHAIGRSVPDTLRRAHHQLFTVFAETIRAGRSQQRDSLVSDLMSVKFRGQSLDEHGLMLNLYSFALGANSTTPHVAAHLLIALAGRPHLWQEVIEDPQLTSGLIEEGVRWSSPTHHLVRRVTADTELGGVRLREGDWVCAWIASANRDQQVFDRPYEFDPHRSPNPHLGFGAGPHYCIGAPSSRFALHVMFEELARQRVRFEVTAEPSHLRSNWINGITCLPMRFST